MRASFQFTPRGPDSYYVIHTDSKRRVSLGHVSRVAAHRLSERWVFETQAGDRGTSRTRVAAAEAMLSAYAQAVRA